MAKVYSWEVSKTPKKYAYIVSPKNLTDVYIGNELKGSNLEKVKEWAMNCTETEYEAQFEKMVAACASQGYNVEFESVVTYMNVDSTCDNLRGPAGRGIDRIGLYKKDEVQNISVYNIYYTDGTYDTFEVQNGFNGRDGIDGTPGAKGDSGVSSKFIIAYTSSGIDEDGNRYPPSRPEGGSYDFTTNKMTYPDGWGANDEGITPPVWMSTRTFSSSEASTDKEWSAPTQITGENGLPGADGVTTEFIYYLDNSEPSVEGLPSPNEPGYVPDEDTGWTASPTGVDEDNLTEWCSLRKMNQKTKEWGPWEKPFIWSKYGVNGQDGDGVQYIYLKNKGTLPLNPTPAGYDVSTSEVYGAYQSKDKEWMPYADILYTNLYGESVIYETGQENSGIWTDNPSDVTAEYHSLWVSSRKYRKNPDTNKMEWGAFSNPALWSRFGQDGKNATSIRKLYALSDSTSNPPDLPSDSTYTGDWGTGFPVGYVNGENVVWGTEAEIWAHNYEFVMSYKMVSKKNANGEVVPPRDAEGNSVEMPEIPSEERTDYKYIIVNDDYYEWTGGWCTPYLVTGVKGEAGSPVNYTIYVFCFGYADTVPEAPTTTGFSPKDSFRDENGLIWYDFPDTSEGRFDGATDENGRKMRWYQCPGYVNGYKGTVDRWGDVSPCNGNDGAKGNNVEMRFAVTKDDKEPELIETDKVTGRILREPTLYDENGDQIGWFTTDNELPPLTSTGVMWQIWATINGEDDSVMGVNNKYWNGPRRVSGEKGDKGDQGIQGPAGKRGVTGIPGAQLLTMYCLGTYDAPFGSNAYESNVMPEELTDWYKGTEMPYVDCLEARSDKDINRYLADSAYKGRVIKLINTQQGVINGSTINDVTHTYYLIKYNMTTSLLAENLTPEESEEYNIYMWCIQGSEKWVAGDVKRYVDITRYENGNVIPPEDADDNNTLTVSTLPTTKQDLYKYIIYNNKYYEWQEIDGDDVQHNLAGVEWYKPFKTQGTNGLRGLTGTRGQVVYPMGVYNSEEVYITTEDKAPYVYDPNDGLYYVYNIVGTPWVGLLPGYNKETGKYDNSHKTILIHPSDAESSFAEVDSDPTEIRVKDTNVKYLLYEGKYYIWNENTSRYSIASKYKYSIDGSGNDGTWMGDQKGDTPANNYANLTNDNRKPAWVRFESFEALYTSIGIIENGMIGSAVYNNEFMFSQQGIGKNGSPTNYAVVSGKDTTYGFLSGYEYDEDGKFDENGRRRHWKYSNTDTYINNTDVDPYEKDENGDYIHTFMPNVCINFATGQMWTSCGKAHFNYDGTGYLADNAIRWGYEATEENPNAIAFEIGELDEEGKGQGIKYHNGALTIGPFESFTDEQTTQYQNFVNEIKGVVNGFQGQIDDKIETHYQDTDPSGEWDDTTKKKHVGDMWLYSGTSELELNDGQKIKIGTTYVYTYDDNEKKYQWVEQTVPQEVFDKIDGKANIFTFEDGSPNTPTNYHKGDLWILQRDIFPAFGFKKGVVLIAVFDMNEDYGYDINDWETQLSYTDDTNANLALTQIANIADDGYVSPGEMMALKQQKENIKTAYNVINEQLHIINATNDIGPWEVCYLAAIGAINYHTNKNNAVSDPTSEYYNCIPINKDSFAKIEAFFTEKTELEKKYFTTIDETTAKKEDFAKQLGYDSYDDMVEKAEAKETIIKGGHINTSLIEAEAIVTDALLAKTINTGSLTVDIIETKAVTAANGVFDNLTVDKLNTMGSGVDKSTITIQDDDIKFIDEHKVAKTQITLGTTNITELDKLLFPTPTDVSGNMTISNLGTYRGSLTDAQQKEGSSNIVTRKDLGSFKAGDTMTIYINSYISLNGSNLVNGDDNQTSCHVEIKIDLFNGNNIAKTHTLTGGRGGITTKVNKDTTFNKTIDFTIDTAGKYSITITATVKTTYGSNNYGQITSSNTGSYCNYTINVVSSPYINHIYSNGVIFGNRYGGIAITDKFIKIINQGVSLIFYNGSAYMSTSRNDTPRKMEIAEYKFRLAGDTNQTLKVLTLGDEIPDNIKWS